MFRLDDTRSFYTVPAFREAGFVCAFSTRIGGVSPPPFESLNTSLNVGDARERVLRNRARLSESLGFDARAIVAAQQVHGCNISIVGEGNRGRGALNFEDGLPGTDALITSSPGLPLAVFTADCVPILIADLGKRAVAAIHAGWRGTAKGVARRAVKLMREKFESDPSHYIAAIGPSIGPCCYEVGPEVVEAVGREFSNGGKVDLWAANQDQLEGEGIPPQNIFVSRICTFHNPELFYSYRRDGKRTGGMMNVIFSNA
ncbi:MAG: peptidoglycan editing factor PgeF [bacterium]